MHKSYNGLTGLGMDIKKLENLTWTPVRTKPRQEKKLAEYCTRREVTCYLPLRLSLKRYNRRTISHYVPMFPGYVFCALDEDIYRDLLLSGSIVFRINVNNSTEDRLIQDLLALREFETMTSEKEVIIRPELVPGARIKVRSGPLKGVVGVIERRKTDVLITVNVEILGQSVATHIDIGDLEMED